MRHFKSSLRRPMVFIALAMVVVMVSVGVAACAYPPPNAAEQTMTDNSNTTSGVMAQPETLGSFVTTNSQPGDHPQVIIKLQTENGDPIAGVDLTVVRDIDMKPIAHAVSDSAGEAVIDLSAEKAAALERARRSPDGQDTTNYTVSGQATTQDSSGLWHYQSIHADFPRTFIDRDRYLAYWMDETRREEIRERARSTGDLSLEEDSGFAVKMLADADSLEGEAVTVLEITPPSAAIQQGGRVIIAPGK